MKILVSAYACETGRGSEGEIGWRLVMRLAANHDVWVITRANLRSVHEAAFRDLQKPRGLNFVYFDLPFILRFYKNGSRFFLLYYYMWQVGVAILARRLSSQTHFDVLHHLIGGMDWMPSGLALCPGHFVWGPVGSENTHPKMSGHLPLASRVKDWLRMAMRWWMRNMDPFVCWTGTRAKIVLTHTPETMPPRYKHKLVKFTQTGIENSPNIAHLKKSFVRGKHLRLVYAGELKDWKGSRLALESALTFFETEPNAILVVIGDGPLRSEMESIARRHPEGNRVIFLGKITMNRLIEELNGGDIFIYPSYHHGLATVVLQAMITGLPIVCIEGDAIARTIKSRGGIVVSLSENRDPVEGLAEALLQLARDEPKRQTLAAEAQKIALEEHCYNKLAGRLETLLQSVASESKPDDKMRREQ